MRCARQSLKFAALLLVGASLGLPNASFASSIAIQLVAGTGLSAGGDYVREFCSYDGQNSGLDCLAGANHKTLIGNLSSSHTFPTFSVATHFAYRVDADYSTNIFSPTLRAEGDLQVPVDTDLIGGRGGIGIGARDTIRRADFNGPGKFRFKMKLTGSIESLQGESFSGVEVAANGAVIATELLSVQSTTPYGDRRIEFDRPLSFEIPYDNGAVSPWQLTMGIGLTCKGAGCRVSADLWDTLRFTGFDVLDATGRVVPNAVVESGSGFNYMAIDGRVPAVPAAGVPEPSSFALAAIAMIACFGRKLLDGVGARGNPDENPDLTA